jgi:hypothetical protein
VSWAAFVILGAVVGFVAGRELSVRRRTGELAARLRRVEGDHLRAQADLKAARIDRDYYHQRFEQSLIDIARIEADRAAYRKIAESHELSWPDAPPQPSQVATPVWRNRRYAHHPASNLAALAADLAPHLDHEIRLTLTITPLGGWESRIRTLGPLEWAGPGHRVLEELRCLLQDDDTRLMSLVEGEKTWADRDSPLIFQIDLDRVEIAPPGVHIHEVEVLRVEKQIEERIIEQPIIIEVPLHRLNDPTPEERIGLTKEEVIALFDQQLERKLAELGMHRHESDRDATLSMIARGVRVERDKTL